MPVAGRSATLLALLMWLLAAVPGALAAGVPALSPTPNSAPGSERETRVLLMYAEDRLAPAFVAQDEAFRPRGP